MAELLTFGCRLNLVESAAIGGMAGHLEGAVVNTCAVTTEAERQARQAIARLHRERPGAPIVVTGCAAQIDPARWASLPGVTRVLGNAEKLDPLAWAGTGSAVGDIAALRRHAPAMPRPGPAPGRARVFLDVQQGCDHACTFCIIPQGRGRNRSVPAAEVAAHVGALADAGCNEVVLTGVDLASWGADLFGAPSLARLLRETLRAVPGLKRLRLSSLDPACLGAPFWDVLATEPRLMPHLHLSIQAGSDLVLKRMRRRHGRAQVLAAVAQARAVRPGLAIGADLIAGFPTEGEAEFAATLRLVDEAAIPYVHVFPYSPRPGTPAARMPQVPVAVRRERAGRLRLAAVPHALGAHRALLGRQVAVVAERGGRGHTEGFAPVRLRGPFAVGALLVRQVVAADAAGVEVA